MLPSSRDQILLRYLRASDLADFQHYRNDAEVGRYQGWSAMSDTQARLFLKEMSSATSLRAGQWTQIAIADSSTDRLIGDIGVHLSDDERQAEIGFTIGRQNQRQGRASLAVSLVIDLLFAHTPAQRIIALTDARNTASIRLLERVGMTLVATGPAEFRGEQCIEHTYALEKRSTSSTLTSAHALLELG